jgi:hypothetical protein
MTTTARVSMRELAHVVDTTTADLGAEYRPKAVPRDRSLARAGFWALRQ